MGPTLWWPPRQPPHTLSCPAPSSQQPRRLRQREAKRCHAWWM
ncbi:hypothetical protein E2C01_066992 [Portunus trituberculatus]|uniref:Uncharacterized protein n=1 Tax=Portunus trituberculatus TaxID=210409 RepID=A0A5B7HJP3_PORTR|nr:hypothetical protein [Portunus trituberculatus]